MDCGAGTRCVNGNCLPTGTKNPAPTGNNITLTCPTGQNQIVARVASTENRSCMSDVECTSFHDFCSCGSPVATAALSRLGALVSQFRAQCPIEGNRPCANDCAP